MGLKIVRILSWILVALIVILSIILLFPVYWPITVYFLIVSLISIWFFKYDYNKHKDIALFEFFVLLIVLFHIVGVKWIYSAFPITNYLLHFLVGVILGIFTVSTLKKRNKMRFLDLFLISIAIVFLLGVGWEIFEYFWDLIVTVKFGGIPAQSSRMDTLLDLISDLLGGILGTLICLFKLHYKKA